MASKHVSFSQYSMYKSCPHQWNLSYAKGLKIVQKSIHLVFGTAFHETLQNYLQVMFDSSAKEADKIHLPTYLKTKLIEHYKANSQDGHFSNPEEMNELSLIHI